MKMLKQIYHGLRETGNVFRDFYDQYGLKGILALSIPFIITIFGPEISNYFSSKEEQVISRQQSGLEEWVKNYSPLPLMVNGEWDDSNAMLVGSAAVADIPEDIQKKVDEDIKEAWFIYNMVISPNIERNEVGKPPEEFTKRYMETEYLLEVMDPEGWKFMVEKMGKEHVIKNEGFYLRLLYNAAKLK